MHANKGSQLFKTRLRLSRNCHISYYAEITEFYYFDAQISIDTIILTSYHNSMLGFVEDHSFLKVTHTCNVP